MKRLRGQRWSKLDYERGPLRPILAVATHYKARLACGHAVPIPRPMFEGRRVRCNVCSLIIVPDVRKPKRRGK